MPNGADLRAARAEQAAGELVCLTAMVSFKTIRARAAKRKGGEAALAACCPRSTSPKALAKLGDDRVLAEMTKRIFSAGFVWSVIEKKWPGFEAAFLGFAPKRLLAQPDEFWQGLASDKRIVRNPQKIMAVRDNAQFVGRHRRRARQLRQVPRRMAGRRPGRPARAARQARLAPRRAHRPVFPALHRQGRLRRLDRRGRLPARCRPRHRREPHLQEGPEEDPGPVQRMGPGDRAALHAPLAHLRHVDRRELRRRDAARLAAAWTNKQFAAQACCLPS